MKCLHFWQIYWHFSQIIFAVATGFPTGQVPLKTRLEEIRLAVEDGATEIDIVINRHYALSGNWNGRFYVQYS